jgi:DNA repair protein RadA
LDAGAIYIDTEGTFRPERIYQIAEANGLDPHEILQRIILCKVYNSSHLELVVRGLDRFIERFKVKLLIVDSVISLHRAEFIGRGTLANRQQRLNYLIHRLLRLAEVFNIAVVVTNQVQSKPDTFFGDPTRPAGGNVIAHACTYRIYLKKSGPQRIATMVDSPYHPYSDIRFQITEKGIEDPTPTK